MFWVKVGNELVDLSKFVNIYINQSDDYAGRSFKLVAEHGNVCFINFESKEECKAEFERLTELLTTSKGKPQ